MFKICTKCGEIKPISEFHFKNKPKGKLRPNCKNCQNKYAKKHYIENHSYYTRKATARNRRQKKLLCDYIKSVKQSIECCPDCNIKFPWFVFEFHHRDSSKKERCISLMPSRGVSLSTLKREIGKCDLVCANCHKIRHWKIRNA